MDPTTRILNALRKWRYRAFDEASLQRAIADVFAADGIPFDREVAIGDGDIIDFVADESIGVEVKMKGPLNAVARQLHRYAQSARVSRLILVTTRRRHLALPASFNGKTLHVQILTSGAF